jgi:hypothetical protein
MPSREANVKNKKQYEPGPRLLPLIRRRATPEVGRLEGIVFN